MKTVLTFCISILSFVGFSQVKYVDGTNGNDSNDGNTTSTAWQTIQKAMDEATAGTTVFIRAGNYNEPNLQLNVSGSSGSNILFRNYPNENPLITGNNQQGTLLYIENQSYFQIEGLTFANLVGNFSVGVEITGDSHDFIFRKNEIHHISWTANTSTLPDSSKNANAFVIYGNTTQGVRNFRVDSCEIHHNTTGFSENLTLDGNVYNFIVSANSVHDNSNIGILCAGNYGIISDPGLDQTRFGRVYDNVCYNNASNYATSAGIYIDGAKEIEVFRNRCYGNGYGIEVGAEEDGTTSLIRIYGNLVYDNLEGGISVGGYDIETTGQVTQSVIRNNTVYNNGTSGNSLGELYLTKVSNTLIENNIFVSKGNGKLVTREAISPQADNSIQYNLWFAENTFDADIDGVNYTSFTGLNTALNQTNSIYANPTFESTTIPYNLYIADGSPAIDEGNPNCFIFVYETDFDGNERVYNNIIDIGAYEWDYYFGLNEVSVNEISLYPNPVSTILNVETNGSGVIKVYTSNGQLIREEFIQDEAEFDVSTLTSGAYFISIESDTAVSTKLFIKD